MKSYQELSEDLKEAARDINPEDFETWYYMVQGVEIAWCSR